MVLWIYPSLHPSFWNQFSGNPFIRFFSEILYSNRNLVRKYVVDVDFLEKHFDLSPKLLRRQVFLYNLWKTLSLPFSGGNLKLKTLQFFVFLCKPHIWEDSVSRLKCQMQGCLTRLKDSLIINIHGRNEFISQTFWISIWDYCYCFGVNRFGCVQSDCRILLSSKYL